MDIHQLPSTALSSTCKTLFIGPTPIVFFVEKKTCLLIMSTAVECGTSNTAEATKKAEKIRLRLILVRHGESQNNIYHEISLQAFEDNRVPDPSITDRGKRQAQCVADYFQSGSNSILSDIDTIYVSPMRRTLETALPLVTALSGTASTKHQSIPPKTRVWTEIYEITGVHERGVGRPGMTRSEMHTQFPTFELPPSVTEHGWYDIKLGRETSQHGKERCRQVWHQLCDMANNLTHNSSMVLIIHGDFIDHLLQAAFGLLELDSSNCSASSKNHLQEKSKVFPTWNTSITALDIHPSDRSKEASAPTRPTLLFHNFVAHLPADLVKTHKLGKC